MFLAYCISVSLTGSSASAFTDLNAQKLCMDFIGLGTIETLCERAFLNQVKLKAMKEYNPYYNLCEMSLPI